MSQFILKRLGDSLIVLLIGSMLCFAFIRLLPGDPAVAMYGDQIQKLSEADRARIIENLGLDEPLPLQYGKWLLNVLQGEWGYSSSTGEKAAIVVFRALQPTFVLMLSAQLLLIILSIVLGVLSGMRRHSLFDHMVTMVSFLLMSIPSFWFALMHMLFFSVFLGVLPTSGMGNDGWRDLFPHLLMPALILALSHIGYYIRLLRNHLAITKYSGFVLALKARGVPERKIIWNHLLPNAFVPFLSYSGVSLASSLAGSVVVETIFSWPGLGRLVLKSALEHDYPVLMAVILFIMVIVIAINLVIDLICGWLDPRFRRQLLEEGSK